MKDTVRGTVENRRKTWNLYLRETLANIWPPSGSVLSFTNNRWPKRTEEYYNWFTASRSDLSAHYEPFCESMVDRFHRCWRWCICASMFAYMERSLALIGHRDFHQVHFRYMNVLQPLFGASHSTQIEASLISSPIYFHRM